MFQEKAAGASGKETVKKLANGAQPAPAPPVISTVPTFMLFASIREFFAENNQTANLAQYVPAPTPAESHARSAFSISSWLVVFVYFSSSSI